MGFCFGTLYVVHLLLYMRSTHYFSCFLKLLLCSVFMFRPRGYKTFFVLNSTEHEILNAHKYENISKFGFFKVQISLECYFSRS